MTVALAAYRMVTAGLSPFVPRLLYARAVRGKELVHRQDERLAKRLPHRPDGEVIWLHGASIGETRLLVQLADSLRKLRPHAFLLFTSQTRTSAELISDFLPDNAQHQLAPVDTPAATRRFISHWQPDLCIFAEGEIWPNLLLAAEASEARLALVNARMTAKSITGWTRLRHTARKLFSHFDLILAADHRTAEGLASITGQDVPAFGSLKVVGDGATGDEEPSLPNFGWQGPVVLGASTHDGEEKLLLDCLDLMEPETRLIIAPRHPERGDEVEALLTNQGAEYARISAGDIPLASTKILLADTVGDMPKWYAMADHVYLGGAHSPGIGGHNPLEPLSHGKRVLTGPHTSNCTDTVADLEPLGAISIVRTAEEIAASCRSEAPIDVDALKSYFAAGRKRLDDAAAKLSNLLSPQPLR
ncbi:MAG: glycosyltransferase N-terminal domain-containing protein [Pseudomonadota bacterium]